MQNTIVLHALILALASSFQTFAHADSYQASGAAGEKELAREIKDEAARMSLAPHSIMVETELMSALDQVRGLRAQVRTAKAQPSPDFLQHYRIHRQEIAESVRSVRTHGGEIREHAGRFPSVVRTEQYKSLDPAITELERIAQQWDKQAAMGSYWNDYNRVTADLEQMERRIMTALEKARGLNARLEVSEIS